MVINLPIITHEDELELAKTEQELVKQIKKLCRVQSSLIQSQQKYAENLTKANLVREMLNRTYRDVIKQMQTLVREKRSNIKDEEVNLFQSIIHQNDTYIESAKKYIDAIKNLTLKKEYFIEVIILKKEKTIYGMIDYFENIRHYLLIMIGEVI